MYPKPAPLPITIGVYFIQICFTPPKVHLCSSMKQYLLSLVSCFNEFVSYKWSLNVCVTRAFSFIIFWVFFLFHSNSLYFIIIIEENYNDVFKFMYTYQSHLALEKLLDLIYQFVFHLFVFLPNISFSFTSYALFHLLFIVLSEVSRNRGTLTLRLFSNKLQNYTLFFVLNILHFMPTVSFFQNFKSFSQMWI